MTTKQVFPFGIVLLLVQASASAHPDPSLLGCWSARRIVSYSPDGVGHESRAQECLLEVQEKRLLASCKTPKGVATYEYSYAITAPGVYLATTVASSVRPDLIGSFREYRYEIAGNRLRITTYPQSTQPAPPTTTVRVESDSEKVECAK